MNPEDLDLPQAPEGVLDPQIPWSYVSPKSRLWVTLKARLTGRPTDGEHYSSYVNITEAEADKLIENLKKDPRGYPSLDQTSGTPVQWMERQQKYQEWLVEEYLEKPFRKKVDAKIEEAEIDRLVNQRRETKVKPTTPLIPPKERKPAPDAAPKVEIIPEIPPEPKAELIPEIPQPVVQSEPEKPKKKLLTDKDLIPPYTMPSNVQRSMTKYGMALDKVGNELSKQNFRIQRGLGYLRRIDEDLDDAKLLLEQMSENYQEALDDFEMEERKKDARKKLVARLTSPFKRKKEPPKTTKKLSQGGFLNTNYPVAYSEGVVSYPGTPIPGLADGGITNYPTGGIPGFAAGGISVTNRNSNIIRPGIYDNPTRGNLAPGTAVIPLNRNYGKQILNQYDQQQYNQALGDVLKKPISVLLGAAVSVYGSVLRSLGPLAGYFNAGIPGVISNVSAILGVSRTTVIDMFGGPAYAGIIENTKDLEYFYKSWRVYMDKNNLYFPGASGPFGGAPLPSGEIAKDILTIGAGGEGLSRMGGSNVSNPPAWIPFSKDAYGRLEYSSGFGMRSGKPHTGIDLAGDPGIKIISPFAGKVSDVDHDTNGSGYGNYVEIQHDAPKIFTFYGHMKDIAQSIQTGYKVKAGEVIGTLGNSGRSTGPHLHWEVRTQSGGGQIDPVQWTQDNKPSFDTGGNVLLRGIQQLFKGRGSLSTKGVRAGFTGMSKEGFDAIMSGDKFKLGRWKPQLLGRGAYNAPTVRGAARYAGAAGSMGGAQTPGGIIKTIVPRGAARSSLIDIIEPQSRVSAASFDKGKLLADKLLKGEWSKSPLANRLRQQLTSGEAVQTMTRFSGLGRGAALIRVVSGIAEASNPIGWGITGGQLLTPLAINLAKQRREAQQQRLQQLVPSGAGARPSDGSIPTIVPTKPKPQFIDIDIPTITVMSVTQMRRM